MIEKNKEYVTAIKADKAERTITAIVSSDSIDSDNEIVLPSGLQNNGERIEGGMPNLLLFHDRTQPVGKWLWFKVEDNKVIGKAKVSDTSMADDVFTMIDDGIIGGTSIGLLGGVGNGPPTEDEIKEKSDWKEVDFIWRNYFYREVSLVDSPANKDAKILDIVKQSKLNMKTISMLEKALTAKETARVVKEVKADTAAKQIKEMNIEDLFAAVEKRLNKNVQLDIDKIVKKAISSLSK